MPRYLIRNFVISCKLVRRKGYVVPELVNAVTQPFKFARYFVNGLLI